MKLGGLLLARLASFDAGEIASEAIWIDANRSNEARRTTTDDWISSFMSINEFYGRREINASA